VESKKPKNEDADDGPRREDPSQDLSWGFVTEHKLEGVQIQPCFQCREQITSKSASIKVQGNLWHKKCFKCQECKQKITATKFPKFQGEKYCSEKCVKVAALSMDKDKLCAECGRGLNFQILDLGGIKVHPSCFKCFKCKKKLKGDFMDEAGKIYCGQKCLPTQE